MATDLDSSFSDQFTNINSKLKKRFMRKPNLTEATNEFTALAIQCEHTEQPTFAGHAYIGAAKCESSAGNILGEAEYYLAAARQFMNAEIKLSSLKCYSPVREDLEAAIGCYIQAFNKYQEDSILQTSVLMELANHMVQLNHKSEAISYYEKAVENINENNVLKLNCLSNLLTLNLQLGRYSMALEFANKIMDCKINIPASKLLDVQVTRVLLALLVGSAQKTGSLKVLFTDILNDDDDAIFEEDLRLKLQSIIICSSMKDVEALIQVSAETEKFFTLEQNELLFKIITSIEMSI